MSIQVLQVSSLAITANVQWSGVMGSLSRGSSSEWFLTAFAVVALILAVMLSIWVYAKRARTETNLRDNITDLTITTFKLRQEKDELAAANKELQQLIAELSRKQAAVLQNIK